MARNTLLRALPFVVWCSTCLSASLSAQTATPFRASGLVKPGDSIKHGAYVVNKLGDRSYQIVEQNASMSGPDIYLVRGTKGALLIDLGNNLVDGMPARGQAAGTPARPTAAEELRNIAYGLAAKLPLEVAVTHAHPDHIGMVKAFAGPNKAIWIAEQEVSASGGARGPSRVDPAAFRTFTAGKKTFDLGDGHVVDTFLVRGHTTGGTVFILKKELMIFTGDALGSGLGQTFSAESVKRVAEDSQKLVEYIKADFSPFDRYALKVFPGHSVQMAYGGYMSEAMEKTEVGYLDWRFIQNVASCANGILKGRWLVEHSGLRYVARQGQGLNGGMMVFGIAAMAIPLEAAYEAAGLTMPKQ